MASAPAMIPAASAENDPGSMTTEAPSFSRTTQACSCLVSFIFCYLRELGRTGEPGRAAESGASARTVPPALVRDNQGVTTGESDATSFGSVADSYDRVRPGPAPAALDWLVPPACAVAVDLGAGPGLFPRALLGRAARVVAVEPDARMREVLARRSPAVDVRAGRGEAMPL